MTTATTRVLSYQGRNDPDRDLFDTVAVRVDGVDWLDSTTRRGKWGYIKIAFTSIGVTMSGTPVTSGIYGDVDLRTPRHMDPHDVILCEKLQATSTSWTGSFAESAYIFCVNNGMAPPCALVNPDGTWDLLHLRFQLPKEPGTLTGYAQLVYTLTTVDLTPSNPPGSSTTNLTLSLKEGMLRSDNLFGKATSTWSGTRGYYKVALKNLTTSQQVKVPYLGQEFAPNFYFGSPGRMDLCRFQMPKYGGLAKNFEKEAMMLFACNGGKIDSNTCGVFTGTSTGIMQASLSRTPQHGLRGEYATTLNIDESYTSVA